MVEKRQPLVSVDCLTVALNEHRAKLFGPNVSHLSPGYVREFLQAYGNNCPPLRVTPTCHHRKRPRCNMRCPSKVLADGFLDQLKVAERLTNLEQQMAVAHEAGLMTSKAGVILAQDAKDIRDRINRLEALPCKGCREWRERLEKVEATIVENEKFNEGVEEYNQRVKEENEKKPSPQPERSWKEWKLNTTRKSTVFANGWQSSSSAKELTGPRRGGTDKVSFAAYKEATDAIIRDFWTALG